jgi:hypothetical protein
MRDKNSASSGDLAPRLIATAPLDYKFAGYIEINEALSRGGRYPRYDGGVKLVKRANFLSVGLH